jgi:uncharacterized protein
MLTRRLTLSLLSASAIAPGSAFAKTPKVLSWDDLIPQGVPYGEIIGQGEMDVATDQWSPIFDENASKLNEELNGALVKIPGFIIPIEQSSKGVTQFMLVPYVGACIHTPPPPANQLVLVDAKKPWPNDKLWDAVWVSGTLRTQLQSTDLGETGYALRASAMEVYEW